MSAIVPRCSREIVSSELGSCVCERVDRRVELCEEFAAMGVERSAYRLVAVEYRIEEARNLLPSRARSSVFCECSAGFNRDDRSYGPLVAKGVENGMDLIHRVAIEARGYSSRDVCRNDLVIDRAINDRVG